ncbi:MAG: DUF4173 domain-containing protein [Pirellulaceae bacterium]|nr:DUF4173 domain-containing protein [Pirellulaceae bacterium]
MAHDITGQDPLVTASDKMLWGGQAISSPMRPKETFAVLLWTVLADWLIFRTQGFTGPALFFAGAPLLFLAGPLRNVHRTTAIVLVGSLLLLSVRLIWLGTGLNILSAVALLVALAMVASGHAPLVAEGLVYAARVWLDGFLAVANYQWLPPRDRTTQHAAGDFDDGVHQSGFPATAVGSLDPAAIDPVTASSSAPNVEASGGSTADTTAKPTASSVRPSTSSWLLPLVAVIVFGGIFVFANPDLLESVSLRLSHFSEVVQSWFAKLSLWEIPFCLAALVIGAGLLRPVLPMPHFGPRHEVVDTSGKLAAPLFTAFRNTLWTLIALFSVYLVFEFATLWRREFPAGFYYAGYAHQGAAWLTFALALATGLLSLVFSGSMLHDARLHAMRRLAWIWSAQNFLLAIAVYNRLLIYVGYNGMTRMRTIGFFGITLVVIGFTLVLYKIGKNRGFWWLIRAQLIALVLTVIGYGVFPVDWMAHRYNVARVTDGYLHPSVMIAVKEINDEGVLPLIGLVDTPDPIIREGVLAMLAQKQAEIEAESEIEPWHWTKYQGATSRLYKRLVTHQQSWDRYRKQPRERREAMDRFVDYAMQWY